MNKGCALTFHMESPLAGDIESRGDFKNPIVILLGWTGANNKQLAKYSDIYLKKGYVTISCTIPVRVVVYDRVQLPQLASQLVNFLKQNEIQSHPIFFHVFSTGGAFVYSYTLKEIAGQKNPEEFDIRGTIFDSAPFWPTFKAGYTAVVTVVNACISFTFGLANAIAFLFMFLALVQTLWAFMKEGWTCSIAGTFQRPGPVDQKVEMFPIHDYLTRIWKLKNHSFLFLYSEMDTVTPYREVEEIAGTLQDRGNSVQRVKFEGSDHVLHYKKYPQEYNSAVTEFIEGIMESYHGAPIYWDEYN